MSGRLRAVLISGCAVLTVLYAGEARATLSEGLGGAYSSPSAPEPSSADATADVESPRPLPGGGASVALRELEPFLSGLGAGL